MTVEVRAISGQEFRPWLESIHVAFGEELHDETAEALREVLADDRCLAAFDGDQIVGGAAAYDYSLTVPGGGALPTAGVTLVGVQPTHRRRGILRQMMARQLADARAAGDALAIPYASEGVIYQRFGYGLATLNGSIDIKRANAGFRNSPTSSGGLRLVDAAEAGQTFPPVYDAVAAQVPGFFSRSQAWWQAMNLPDPASWRRGASPKYRALASGQIGCSARPLRRGARRSSSAVPGSAAEPCPAPARQRRGGTTAADPIQFSRGVKQIVQGPDLVLPHHRHPRGRRVRRRTGRRTGRRSGGLTEPVAVTQPGHIPYSAGHSGGHPVANRLAHGQRLAERRGGDVRRRGRAIPGAGHRS
ncbi:hypothetical protein BH23CHL7_BH23CHL7_19050 [soil metagenome]